MDNTFPRAVVLISGNGSNLQSIIDAQANGLPIELVQVISNRPNAGGLQRAQAAGIGTRVVDHKNYPDRASFDQALSACIDEYTPSLIILAGFMRILTPNFVTQYLGKMLNIHPSLLPAYPGLNTHQRALNDGVTRHGASVHFVTNELDGGPIIVQAVVPVLAGDDAKQLQQRVLKEEHKIYPMAIEWYAQGRLRYANNQALLDENVLDKPISIQT